MSENTHENSHDRVSFGDRPNEVMPVDWASKMLTLLRKRNAALFGGLLAQAITDTPPKALREPPK